MKFHIPKIPFIKTKYRIREVVMLDGKATFYPQQRNFFIWKDMDGLSNYVDNGPARFRTLETAEKYLFDITMKERAETVGKKRNHEFNAVFHKLKQENQS